MNGCICGGFRALHLQSRGRVTRLSGHGISRASPTPVDAIESLQAIQWWQDASSLGEVGGRDGQRELGREGSQRGQPAAELVRK